MKLYMVSTNFTTQLLIHKFLYEFISLISMDKLKIGLILDYINKLDPDKKIIDINLKGNEVTYHVKNNFKTKLNLEEWVRIFYVIKLIKQNEFKQKDLEIEKEYEFSIGRGGKKPRVDIVIYKNDLPHILIELKESNQYEKERYNSIKGQLFGVANNLGKKQKINWLVYATITAIEDITEEVLVIDYNNFKEFESWDDAGQPIFHQLPDTRGRFVRILIKSPGNLQPLNKDLIFKLKNRLHDTLWRGGTREDNKIFFNLLKLIISKVYDENETEDGKPYRFQLYYQEDSIDYKKTKDEILKLYRESLAGENYLNLSEKRVEELKELEASIDNIELTAEEIVFVVSELFRYSLKITDYDVLSIFFEMILRHEFKQTKGLYFTHTNLVSFILYGLEIDNLAKTMLKNERKLPVIMDSSVGSGTFLTEAMKIITNSVLDDQNKIAVTETLRRFIRENFDEDRKRHPWAREFLYGIDKQPHLALTTKVNMVMHGDGHIHVYAYDALNDFGRYEDLLNQRKKSEVYPSFVNENFDVIVSNPPFSVKITKNEREKYKDYFPILGTKSSEILFIERWYQLLRPKGRLGVVLPESIFDTTENMNVRLFLFKHFWIKSIISLPGGAKKGAFSPYTGTKTSLLFAQKKSDEEIKIWQELWDKYDNEFQKIKRRIIKYFPKKEKKIKDKKLEESLSKEELLEILGDYLLNNFDKDDKELDIKQLLEKYDEIVNSLNRKWWIFHKISKEIDNIYPEWKTKIFIAHTDFIGYKRTKRREDKIKNNLFIEKNSKIIIDKTNPKSVIDFMRGSIRWEN